MQDVLTVETENIAETEKDIGGMRDVDPIHETEEGDPDREIEEGLEGDHP